MINRLNISVPDSTINAINKLKVNGIKLKISSICNSAILHEIKYIQSHIGEIKSSYKIDKFIKLLNHNPITDFDNFKLISDSIDNDNYIPSDYDLDRIRMDIIETLNLK